MRKVLKVLSVFLLTLIISTGCGKKDAKSEFIDALNKTNSANSLNTKVNVTMSVKEPESGVNTSFEGNADLDIISKDEESALMHGNFGVSTTGISYTTEGYIDITKEKVGVYFNALGKWIKAESEISEEDMKEILDEYEKVSSNYNIDNVSDYIKSIKEEKSDKKGYTKLNVVFDKDKLNEELKKTYNNAKDEILADELADQEVASSINEAQKYIDKGLLTQDIDLVVYINKGYISIIEIDLSKIIDNIANSVLSGDELEYYKKLELSTKMKYEFSNFNNIDNIVIPDDAKNGEDIMKAISDSNLNDSSSKEV